MNNDNRIEIQQIGPEQGLPERNIRFIAQDTIGYLWLATNSGIFRYDGYRFENFTHLLTSKYEGSFFINQIKADRFGRLWLAHVNGVSVVDPYLLTAKNIDLLTAFPGKLPTLYALKIHFDKKENAWISFSDGILAKVNNKLQPLILYRSDYTDTAVWVRSLYVSGLFADDNDNFYLYTNRNYLDVISPDGIKKERIPLPDYSFNNISFKPELMSFLENDTIEMQYSDYRSGKTIFLRYPIHSSTNLSLSSISPLAFPDTRFTDRNGNQWISNTQEIGFIERATGNFVNLSALLKEKINNKISFLCPVVADDNTIWLSSGTSLVKIYRGDTIFNRYLVQPVKNATDAGSSIRGITEDATGNIWICSYGYPDNNINYTFHTLDIQKQTIQHQQFIDNNQGKTYLPYKAIFQGDYIYAVTDGTDLLKINRHTMQNEKIEVHKKDGSQFVTLFAVNDSLIWMGSLKGMFSMNTKSGMLQDFNNKQTGGYIQNIRINYFMPWGDHYFLASICYRLKNSSKLILR